MTNRQYVKSIYPQAIIKKIYATQTWPKCYWLIYKNKEEKDSIASGNSTQQTWEIAKWVIEVNKKYNL